MIRAAQMLVAMRATSVGFQLDDHSLTSMPDFASYFGYVFHVGTAAFGPWIEYKDYVNIEKNNKQSVTEWLMISSRLVSCHLMSSPSLVAHQVVFPRRRLCSCVVGFPVRLGLLGAVVDTGGDQ